MKMNVILIVMTASLMNVQQARRDISDFPEESQNTHENIHFVCDIWLSCNYTSSSDSHG